MGVGFYSPGNLGNELETFLVVAAGSGGGEVGLGDLGLVLLTRNTTQCTEQLPFQRGAVEMSFLLRLEILFFLEQCFISLLQLSVGLETFKNK